MDGVSQAGVRPTAAATATLLQQRDEFVPLELTVTEDGCQEPRADGLPGMDRHNRPKATGVTKEMVAALDPRYLEPRLP